MIQDTDDLRIQSVHPLLSPAILSEEIPMTERASVTISEARWAAEQIIRGKSDRLIVIAGPCSIHDTEAAREYAGKLMKAREQLSADLCIFMRVYFEKPRTTVGWKGLINDPDIDNSFRINKGLRQARKLLQDLAETGLPAATEFLDTIVPQFIADLIAWGAIGARTTESQVHRELASGLSMPVGFKNGTDGNVQIAIDAVSASRQPHHFLSVTKQGIAAIVQTRGNDSCHLILRGSKAGPNFDAKSVESACDTLKKNQLHPGVMVDCSHGNSSKDHRKQPLAAQSVADQIAGGSKSISGVMLESHLVEGNQSYESDGSALYGKSITDACMSWDQTVPVLEQLAEAVRKRRETA
jgi:3-deoxy-7-phosphoheptulonate synthase